MASLSYKDTSGKMVSLEDFKGKYVYIDFWATWCVNCIKEFPFLNKIEERFKNEKIEFIGISIDKQEAKEKWKKMVVNKELKNVQLLAPSQGYPEKNDINDAFMKSVYLNSYYLGIPHYALINPEGRIIDAFFYRPSNKKGEQYLSKILLNNQRIKS
ncbi:MAG: TlpA disulfide reductase family protein [Saprospiraceae bacterium]|nr:TlpA disulfide reductase family protein [Saprospiraceae bacterium]